MKQALRTLGLLVAFLVTAAIATLVAWIRGERGDGLPHYRRSL